ncbi:hypothetical protein RN001_005544 [Aquatica leii]|uniref:Uncharacterized protein n=1 Tax=Aquatica leii TaxID=1421715 RepID=A0AAN7SS31_9COLE|nr:hypothetical protein RN001_005544 [Aquatica leii]
MSVSNEADPDIAGSSHNHLEIENPEKTTSPPLNNNSGPIEDAGNVQPNQDPIIQQHISGKDIAHGSGAITNPSSSSSHPQPQPSCSKTLVPPISFENQSQKIPDKMITFEALSPIPQPVTSKASKSTRKKHSEIITSSPMKTVLEENERSQVIRKVLQEESSDDENIEIPTQDSSSDDDNYLEKIIEEANIEMETEREIDNTSILEGDFVLVELKGKKSARHYVAEIIKNFGEGHFEVIYMKKMLGCNKFVKCETVYEIDESDIVKKLPKPTAVGGSGRRMEQFSFPIDFMSYNM